MQTEHDDLDADAQQRPRDEIGRKDITEYPLVIQSGHRRRRHTNSCWVLGSLRRDCRVRTLCGERAVRASLSSVSRLECSTRDTRWDCGTIDVLQPRCSRRLYEEQGGP